MLRNQFEAESIESTPDASIRHRSMSVEPSPPSFSSAPPSDHMDVQAKDEAFARELEVRERRESDTNDKRQQELAMLLATAEDDEDAEEIVREFNTEEGRERLITGTSDESTANNNIGASSSGASGHPRRTRKQRVKAELADLIGSDEENQVISESIGMNPHQADGVTTRRGTVLGKKRAREEERSVPIPRRTSTREKFDNRTSRRQIQIDNAIYSTRNVDKSPLGPRRSKRLVSNPRRMPPKRQPRKAAATANFEDSPQVLRRSSRIRRNASSFRDSEDDDDDNDEEYEDDSDNMSTGSMRSNGSVGRSDGEMESNDEKETSDLEEQLANETGSSTEEENNRQASRRRSGRLNRLHQGKSSAKKKKRRKRRTEAKSVFDMEEHAANVFTEEERKQRLEALVKQSEDVAMKLNEAMAGEKERHDAKEKERTEAKEGATQGDAIAAANSERALKKTEVEPIWPTGDKKKMQDHQIDGVRWLLTLDSRGLNAILADEMGLGKTIQSIAFLASISLGENRGPHLVIAPKNVVPHWAAEFDNFYPKKFKVITHVGAGEERFERLYRNLKIHSDFDILVTSYELAMRDLLTKPKKENQIAWANRNAIRQFQKLEFEYAVVDEAHRLKNAESKFAIALRNYSQATRRLLLTGTPLSNNLQELWALMNVLNPRIFGSRSSFDEWFSAPFDTSRRALTLSEQSVIVDRLHTILRPFFRRRLRADVCSSFASADEVIISCPQSALQKAITMHYAKSRLSKDMSANNTFQLLRQIANHPYTVCGALYEEHQLKLASRLVAVSGKFLFLHYALPRLVNGGHRVLIFSQFRKVLDFLEDLMDMLNLKYGRLDGETDNEGRDDIVSKFNAEGSDIPVFLLTTRAGGVGLNLQTADTVILFDSDWNPSADLQAVSRIQRIGQKRTVHIMRLVTEQSIDEAIVERGREKLRTEAVAVGAGKFGENQDPAVDAATRQQELTAILTKYERTNVDSHAFLDPNGMVNVECNELNETKKKLETWNPQLLRVGEESLPESEGEVLPLSLSPNSVPEWLRPGANMRSATLALKCQFKWEIVDALRKGIESDRARNGQLPNKRTRRQRFELINLAELTDSGDDDDFKEPSEQIESETSEEIFVPGSEVKKNKANGPVPLNVTPSGIQHASSPAKQGSTSANPRPIQPLVASARADAARLDPKIPVTTTHHASSSIASSARVRTPSLTSGAAPVRVPTPVGTTVTSNSATVAAAFGINMTVQKQKQTPGNSALVARSGGSKSLSVTSGCSSAAAASALRTKPPAKKRKTEPNAAKLKKTPKAGKSEPKVPKVAKPKSSPSNSNLRPVASSHFSGGRKVETVIPFGERQRTPVRRVLPVLQPRANQYSRTSPAYFSSPPSALGSSHASPVRPVTNSQSPSSNVGSTNTSARASSLSGGSASGSRRPQYRYVAPKPKLVAKPFKQGEIIVIDSDDDDKPAPPPQHSSPSPRKAGRQGTMKEMREKAAKRKAELERSRNQSLGSSVPSGASQSLPTAQSTAPAKTGSSVSKV